jgi:diamine N-acetyltransferase
MEMEDADWIYHFENDPSLWRVTQTVTPYSRYAIEQYVLNSTIQDIYGSRELRMVIESLHNKRPVGLIDLFDFDPLNRRAGIGIAIEKQERRKGFAKEALDLMIHHSFSGASSSPIIL